MASKAKTEPKRSQLPLHRLSVPFQHHTRARGSRLRFSLRRTKPLLLVLLGRQL